MARIILMAHNGISGRNVVTAFAGADFPNEPEGANEVQFAGRNFSHAFTREIDGEKVSHYREKVVGEPSDWAKAQANG